ncbi:DUF4810 domain-containing protein [Glaciecola sp. 2405UD65-10]|jgi:hypothetical protein|uniref:DUF4810 domain-containing protein n=1 Tax=Glaciecola sp. 2405UD65-10 TaxID=3397244 RepID=UPI003B59EF92
MKFNVVKMFILATLAAIALTGCKTTEPPLYYYGGYQTSVYSYFKGNESTQSEQIAVLEQAIETASINDKAIAPGVHAHLGMLYFEAGNSAVGLSHFEQEKFLFPESASFINFLIAKTQGE